LLVTQPPKYIVAMTEESESIAKKIAELGESIKQAKSQKAPKEEWEPLLQEMLQCKAQYKTLTGHDFAAPAAAKKEAAAAPPENEEASEKNKEKRAAKAAAKAEREAEKAAKRAEREAREKAKADKLAGLGQDLFGDMPLVQSQFISDKQWTPIQKLDPSLATKSVLIRGSLQKTAGIGRMAFALIRSSLYSVQVVAAESAAISPAMVKYIAALPLESIVDVQGTVSIPAVPVESATQKQVELQVSSFHCVVKAKQALPFTMEDACRADTHVESDVGAYHEEDEVAANDGDGNVVVTVGQKMRLDYRWIDLRTPANQSIFRIESMVGCLFREYLLQQGFIEVHTPKLIAGASEGGSDVFTLNYFGSPACLAMSPQLHKQMTAACSGFER
jgi:aspartyl-tRNA synthetase